jgi:hypothetical protein
MNGDVSLPLLCSIPPALIPQEGDIVDEVDIAVIGDALTAAYRRAAETVARLRRDGWNVNYTRCEICCSHDSVTSRLEAELRLAALGVDLAWVHIRDCEGFPSSFDG